LRQPLLQSHNDDEAIDDSNSIEIDGKQLSICESQTDAVRLIRSSQAPSIVFDKLTLVYRPGLNPALRQCSLHIKSGERFGLCGKTGHGKSSLLSCLLRLRPFQSGRIIFTYDNENSTNQQQQTAIDITSLTLQQLRQSISCITQQPLIFKNTVRMNLDPKQQCTDDEIMNVLSQCHMMNKIQSLFEIQTSQRNKTNDESQSQSNNDESQNAASQKPDAFDPEPEPLNSLLDVQISSSTLSIGESQLLCFARALLSQSRLVLLDEHTAHLEQDTDRLMQDLIFDDSPEAKLKNATVVLIAHRVNALLRCDRVAVMQDGQVAEVGTPQELMSQPGSLFFALVNQQHQSLNLSQSHQSQSPKSNINSQSQSTSSLPSTNNASFVSALSHLNDNNTP
jgi:ATP-binding cassette, subfamily C (CFTR/MRP), member 1